jgi:hypothetical protein
LKAARGGESSGVASSPPAERPRIRPRTGVEPTALRRREAEEFGGRIQWEAVFFGLLAAVGLAALLAAMVLGGLVAAGVIELNDSADSLVDQMSSGGGAILIAIVALSYLTGGYVAARMARFDGWRQGTGLCLLTALMILAVTVSAWISGGDIDPTKSVSLPSNPIEEGPLSHSGWIAAAVAALVALVCAIAGGILGERFHRVVDSAAFDDPEVEPDADVDYEPEPETEVDYEPEPETEVEPQAGTETESEGESGERWAEERD